MEEEMTGKVLVYGELWSFLVFEDGLLFREDHVKTSSNSGSSRKWIVILAVGIFFDNDSESCDIM